MLFTPAKKRQLYLYILTLSMCLVALCFAAAHPVHAATKGQAALIYQGRNDSPKIALTFDDGPDISTAGVLNVLQRERVHATFFLIGSKVARNPGLAQRIVASGHAIGNHTWDHVELSKLTPQQQASEIASTTNEIQRVTGVRPYLTRPPFGEFNLGTREVLAAQGQTAILWNIDPRDWSRPGVPAITTNVLSNVRNGSIILMHDGGGDRSQTIAALPQIIETLRQRGYQFVTIPELLQGM